MHTHMPLAATIYTVPPAVLPDTTERFLTPEERALVMLKKELERLRLELHTAMASSELPRHCGRLEADIDRMLDHQRTVLDPFTLVEGMATDWLKDVIAPLRPSNVLIRLAGDRDDPASAQARRDLAASYEAIFTACEERAKWKLSKRQQTVQD